MFNIFDLKGKQARKQYMSEGSYLVLVCSNCFKDEGLRLLAANLGSKVDFSCPNCGDGNGSKLDNMQLRELAWRFFVEGSVFKGSFGAAFAIQFNEHHFNSDDIDPPEWLKADMKLIGAMLKVGFFHYGPRLWMLGHIEPLEKLQSQRYRKEVIEEIISRYPKVTLAANTSFYRLRKNPNNAIAINEYDSPPEEFLGKGRLDSRQLPILYGSQNIEVCVHECRVTVEDLLYLSTLNLNRDITLIDLTAFIQEDGTQFESLNIAISMLFNAPDHSYNIIREIAHAIAAKGFHGIIYPSYYSQIHAKRETIGNIALFGRPIKDGLVSVKCINRLILNMVSYDLQYGPSNF